MRSDHLSKHIKTHNGPKVNNGVNPSGKTEVSNSTGRRDLIDRCGSRDLEKSDPMDQVTSTTGRSPSPPFIMSSPYSPLLLSPSSSSSSSRSSMAGSPVKVASPVTVHPSHHPQNHFAYSLHQQHSAQQSSPFSANNNPPNNFNLMSSMSNNHPFTMAPQQEHHYQYPNYAFYQ